MESGMISSTGPAPPRGPLTKRPKQKWIYAVTTLPDSLESPFPSYPLPDPFTQEETL
jgi:hypothetical protein